MSSVFRFKIRNTYDVKLSSDDLNISYSEFLQNLYDNITRTKLSIIYQPFGRMILKSIGYPERFT